MKYLMILLLMGCATGAMATDTLTGTELRNYCRAAMKDDPTATEGMQTGYCYGYMMGFLQLIDGGYNYDKGSLSQFTFIDRDITVAQLAEMYVKYVDQHPEDLDVLPAVEVGYILLLDGKAKFDAVKMATPTCN